jgi:hypothetical protein
MLGYCAIHKICKDNSLPSQFIILNHPTAPAHTTHVADEASLNATVINQLVIRYE